MTRPQGHFLGMALLALSMSAAVDYRPSVASETCGEYGTAVHFADSPVAARRQALEEEKLVFVLHVSGNFEVSEYT